MEYIDFMQASVMVCYQIIAYEYESSCGYSIR